MQIDKQQPKNVSSLTKPAHSLFSNTIPTYSSLCGCSVVSDSLQPYGLQPARNPCPWDFPGKNTDSGLPFPPSGDLPDPGIEPVSPEFAGNFFLPLCHLGSPFFPILNNYVCANFCYNNLHNNQHSRSAWHIYKLSSNSNASLTLLML